MVEAVNDKRSSQGIPWATPRAWQAASQSVRFHRQIYDPGFEPVTLLAQKLRRRLESIFSDLDELCIDSCPWCPEPCCLKASVWYDFKDLLFLHFNEQPIPPVQPKANLNMPCRYMGSRGCRLPRMTRPWICTWYLCPTQTAKLRNGHQAKRELFDQTIARIKSERILLENEFIRIIA
jgi:hypothetical protein